ncbi:MAG: bifunctional oligoribonuclease/PAP phosphatase NrnA [Sandaracinaceae bacterium]
MKLIVTHEATDFDAFAAAVAAQRLHPGAVIGLGRHLARPVRDFLALHKDRFPFVRCTSIESAAVDTLIVVDVRSRRRLAHASAVLDRLDEIEQLYVYDHHPAADDDLIGHVDVVEPVGAVTTLLVERLRRVGGDIDVIEATLFALGIYTDTAALTLGNTSPRDARAVAWLLEQGARLPMINRYLYPPLDDAQRRALGQVLGDHEVVTVGGLRVGFGLLRTTRHVEGLAVVTTEACKLENLAALFTVCAVGGR